LTTLKLDKKPQLRKLYLISHLCSSIIFYFFCTNT